MLISLPALAGGIVTSLILSALVGLILGAAVLADAGARPGSPEGESEIDAALRHGALRWQLAVLSLLVAVISGAVTGWLAPVAPLRNAALVGFIGMVAGLILPAPRSFSATIRISMAIATLPATLLGGWMMTF